MKEAFSVYSKMKDYNLYLQLALPLKEAKNNAELLQTTSKDKNTSKQ